MAGRNSALSRGLSRPTGSSSSRISTTIRCRSWMPSSSSIACIVAYAQHSPSARKNGASTSGMHLTARYDDAAAGR